MTKAELKLNIKQAVEDGIFTKKEAAQLRAILKKCEPKKKEKK